MTTDIGGGGERFVPQAVTFAHSAEQHVRRYEWACEQLAGARRILDVACGTGYGSEMLRRTLGSEVVGIDSSATAVKHASQSYCHEGLRFVQDDAQMLSKLKDADFDALVSFETIEHVQDALSFVRSLRRVLRPGGRLLISTPDRRLSSVLYPITGRPHNPHHLREFTLREFVEIMTSEFTVAAIFGQSFVPAALVMWPVQVTLKGICHKLLRGVGRTFLEATYWRGTGTHVQTAESNKGKIACFNVLSCTAR